MRQVEIRTLVFDDQTGPCLFEHLLAGNMNLGRPEHAEIISGPNGSCTTPGVFSTRLFNGGDQVTINLSFRHSRVKIYLKEDRALRVETVINDPGDLGCKRSLEHLEELSAKARACNARLMDAVIARQGSGILAIQSIRADRSPHHECGGAEGPGHALRGPPVRPWPVAWPPGITPSPASPTRASAPG